MGDTTSTGHRYSDEKRESQTASSGVGGGVGIGTAVERAINEGDVVDEAYDEFVEETGITDRQGEKIDERRDVLVGILEEEMSIRDSQFIGSNVRETMIAPLTSDSDADLMVVLDADDHSNWIQQENGAINALRAIKRRIENHPHFSETDVEIDRNVVKVKYHDSTIEIAPAFRYSEVPHADDPRENPPLFDSNDGYVIPDTYGSNSWIRTNPRAYKQRFEARDEAHNGRVSGLTRAMKTWAENNNVPIRSYVVEVMVYNYFAEKARSGDPVPDSYHDLARDFMKSLPERARNQTKEPVYDEVVDNGMDTQQREEVAEKAEESVESLEDVKEMKEAGKSDKAKKKLREEYGKGFE